MDNMRDAVHVALSCSSCVHAALSGIGHELLLHENHHNHRLAAEILHVFGPLEALHKTSTVHDPLGDWSGSRS